MSIEELTIRNAGRNLKYGALGGHIAAWSILGLIFAVDLLLRMEAGTFYKVIGLTFGADVPSAMYIGFVLHMVTGTFIGMLFGYLTSIIRAFNITSIQKSFGLGIITGIATWAVLFMPITIFAVQPSLAEIAVAVEEPRLVELSSFVMVGAIGMHIIYGGMLGFMHYMAVVPTPRDYEE